MGQREIGDAEDACEPLAHCLIACLFGEDDPNSTAQTLDAFRTEVLHGRTDIVNEPLLEEVAVTALQRKLVIVDNGAAHGLVGY